MLHSKGLTGNYQCIVCEKECRGRVTGGRGKYCGTDCRSIHYASRYAGDGNPNYKNAARKECERCGGEFKSYANGRKFCSNECYNATRAKVEKEPKENPAKVFASCPICKSEMSVKRKYCSIRCRGAASFSSRKVNCQHCQSEFLAHKSRERKFCSYPCFVSNGGPTRAGFAATEIIMKKYGAKKDANHNEIMDAIKIHTAVHDLSKAGYGVPDGVVWVNGGWHLFDIKNPNTSYGKRGLNAVQKKWISDWRGGPVYLIYTVEEAFKLATGKFDGLKKVESGGSLENA